MSWISILSGKIFIWNSNCLSAIRSLRTISYEVLAMRGHYTFYVILCVTWPEVKLIAIYRDLWKSDRSVKCFNHTRKPIRDDPLQTLLSGVYKFYSKNWFYGTNVFFPRLIYIHLFMLNFWAGNREQLLI